jgi:hypothetical protein
MEVLRWWDILILAERILTLSFSVGCPILAGLILQGWVFRFPISLEMVSYALGECHCLILARPREEVHAEESLAL